MKIKMKTKAPARESSVIGHFHFPLASFDSVYLRVTQFGYKMDAHNAEFGDWILDVRQFQKRLTIGIFLDYTTT